MPFGVKMTERGQIVNFVGQFFMPVFSNLVFHKRPEPSWRHLVHLVGLVDEADRIAWISHVFGQTTNWKESGVSCIFHDCLEDHLVDYIS